jgi:phosphohistidine phosphatase
MEHLFIIRHAKSSWKETGLDDFDRPLNKRGLRNAPAMAKRLYGQNISPDCILSSPAVRAKTTAKALAQGVGYKNKILYEKDIYEAGLETLLHVINKIDKKYRCVFLIGHNPGLNMLVEYLTNFHGNIPTCGIVHLHLHCKDSQSINSSCTQFVSFDYPKREL